MGKRRGSSADKDREESWKHILKGLVALIEDQQRQLQSLVRERKFLEKRILLQHERWVSDVKLLDDQIYQTTRDCKIKDMARLVEVAKANLIIGMKQKEAILYKHKFEDTDDERLDLKVLFDELSQCLAEPKRVMRSNGKNPDVSALKAERDFAWNQFKKTDTKLQEHVKQANSEVQAANAKVEKLISDLEQSQSSNMEKNMMISALQEDVAMLESDSRKKTEEISRLTKELELLRNNSVTPVTPVLHHCVAESGTSQRGSRNNRHLNGTSVTKNDMDHHSQAPEKGSRGSKRKASETDLRAERPRLFSSKFKVPKLKDPFPL